MGGTRDGTIMQGKWVKVSFSVGWKNRKGFYPDGREEFVQLGQVPDEIAHEDVVIWINSDGSGYVAALVDDLRVEFDSSLLPEKENRTLGKGGEMNFRLDTTKSWVKVVVKHSRRPDLLIFLTRDIDESELKNLSFGQQIQKNISGKIILARLVE